MFDVKHDVCEKKSQTFQYDKYQGHCLVRARRRCLKERTALTHRRWPVCGVVLIGNNL